MNRLQLNIELYEYIMCVYRACYPIHGIVMLHIIHLEANKSVSKAVMLGKVRENGWRSNHSLWMITDCTHEFHTFFISLSKIQLRG